MDAQFELLDGRRVYLNAYWVVAVTSMSEEPGCILHFRRESGMTHIAVKGAYEEVVAKIGGDADGTRAADRG